MDGFDYANALEQALTERDLELKEKVLPEINIGLAVPIKADIVAGVDWSEYGERSVLGKTDNGIIGKKTTSVLTIDSEIEFKRAPVATWAKGAVWTHQEIAVWERFGMNIQTTKLDDVYANGMATIQRAGYIGHKEVKGQTGLLNSPSVPVFNEVTKKTIAEMTATEVIDFILAVYKSAWEASNYQVAPTTIAMDASDFISLCSKFDESAKIVGVDAMPLSALDKIYAALAKASNNEVKSIEFIKVPSEFARNIQGKSRLVVYSKNEEYLNMSVLEPELLDVRPRDMLSFEAGYIASFSGVKWIYPKSAVYGVYTNSK